MSEATPPVSNQTNLSTPKGCQKRKDEPQRREILTAESTKSAKIFSLPSLRSLRSLRFIFWHPFRVLDVLASVPGVSLRSTPGYFLSSLRDAKGTPTSNLDVSALLSTFDRQEPRPCIFSNVWFVSQKLVKLVPPLPLQGQEGGGHVNVSPWPSAL